MAFTQHTKDLLMVGMLALGITTGTVLTDEDLSSALNEGLQNTNTLTSFNTAKKHIYNDIDNDGGSVTCVYAGSTVTMEVLGDGSLRPRSADGFQVEHTWASKAEWTDASGHFLRDSIPGADLHHLFPACRGLNGTRSDHEFGVPATEIRELLIDTDGTLHQSDEGAGGTDSGCSRGKDAHGNVVFMPREEHRGNVARAMFYMSIRYWWEIPDSMEATLRDWHDDDDVDAAERARNDRIEAIQHNRNPFIDDPELVDKIGDF